MARLNIDRQLEIEPKRMQFAKEQITKLGYEITFESGTSLKFIFKGCVITLFPYSGWHTGANITDGRGIKKLLRQIDPERVGD